MSNAGNFTIGLTEVVKLSDTAYSVGRLLVLFIIFFGLLVYLGRLLGERYKLKKLSRFEIDRGSSLIDLRSSLIGLIVFIMLAMIVIVIATYVLISQADFFVFFGLVEWTLLMLILVGYLLSKKPIEEKISLRRPFRVVLQILSEKIEGVKLWYILVVTFILLVVITPTTIEYLNRQQFFYILNIFTVSILLIMYLLSIGIFRRPVEHEVSVYLSDAPEPLENLVLYQTTDVDYRFRKGDEEIIIPISLVKKVEYKTPPKEDLKRVSARASCEERSSERSADKG